MTNRGTIDYYAAHHYANDHIRRLNKDYQVFETHMQPRRITQSIRNVIRKLTGRREAHV